MVSYMAIIKIKYIKWFMIAGVSISVTGNSTSQVSLAVRNELSIVIIYVNYDT